MVLAVMGHTRMVKRTIEAQAVLLGAALGAVAVAVAIGTRGVAVGINRFSTLSCLENRTKAGRIVRTLSGSTETTTEAASLDSLESWSLLRYMARDIVTSFELYMDHLRKVKRSLSSLGRTWTGKACIASCIAVGAMVNESQGEDPVG